MKVRKITWRVQKSNKKSVEEKVSRKNFTNNQKRVNFLILTKDSLQIGDFQEQRLSISSMVFAMKNKFQKN